MEIMMDRRAVPRYQITWPGKVIFGDVTTLCLLEDLSLAGARFCCDTYYAVKVPLRVEFDLSFAAPGCVFSLPASVVWNRERGADFEQGLVFTEMDDDTLRRLSHALNFFTKECD